MYKVKTEISFDAAHFLKDYDGKCGNIHGHRWRVVLEVCAKELKTEGNERGMVADFKDLKKELRILTEGFDHKFIIEEGSLKKELYDMLFAEGFKVVSVPFRPTAECFAKYFFETLKKRGVEVNSVTVYETPRNCATYGE